MSARQLAQQAARLGKRSFATCKQALSSLRLDLAPAAAHLPEAALAPRQAVKFPWGAVSLSFAAAGVMSTAEATTAHAQPQAGGAAAAAAAAPNGTAAAAAAEAPRAYKVAFVLGGPGSGKGTQSSKMVEEFGVVHLSAGDLLRAHIKSGSADGKMVAEMIEQGQIVPSSVTVGLLQGAMQASGKSQFLIDGFPRNDENRAAFEGQTGIQPSVIFFFDCPEEVMERRLLGRNEGRTDDNEATIRKRFAVFLDQSLPVVAHYEAQGKVARIAADREPDEVYKEVRRTFLEFMV